MKIDYKNDILFSYFMMISYAIVNYILKDIFLEFSKFSTNQSSWLILAWVREEE